MLFQPLQPMLLTMQPEAVRDSSMIWEIKWDGWRILLHKNGDEMRAFTRQGNDVTSQFPELQQVGASISADSVILDTEGICLRDGRSVFEDFDYRGRLRDPRKIQYAMKTHPASFVVLTFCT